MTPDELREARRKLGLGTPGLGKALETDPRTIRRWEEGRHPIPGLAAVAIRLLLRDILHNGMRGHGVD